MRLAAFCVLACAAASAQQFEVASIKASTGENNGSSGINTGHGRLDANNVTLQRCIIGAWGVGPHQIFGGPAWLSTDRFEISAKADQPTDDDALLNLMLRALLADRFKLALHTETRTMQAYVLEVGKAGAKLTKTGKSTPGGASTTTNGTNTGTSIQARQTSMDLFAKVLAREMGLPVVDRTGLSGDFDFNISWTPDRIRAAAPADSDLPTIFTAVQDQLGLRLRAEKVPIEVLIIDRAEKPTEN
jgi:uncharacterized protein (TIGR03435 family)